MGPTEAGTMTVGNTEMAADHTGAVPGLISSLKLSSGVGFNQLDALLTSGKMVFIYYGSGELTGKMVCVVQKNYLNPKL